MGGFDVAGAEGPAAVGEGDAVVTAEGDAVGAGSERRSDLLNRTVCRIQDQSASCVLLYRLQMLGQFSGRRTFLRRTFFAIARFSAEAVGDAEVGCRRRAIPYGCRTQPSKGSRLKRANYLPEHRSKKQKFQLVSRHKNAAADEEQLAPRCKHLSPREPALFTSSAHVTMARSYLTIRLRSATSI